MLFLTSIFALLALFQSIHASPSLACNPDGTSSICSCIQNNGIVVTVDCSGVGLSALPSGIPATATTLNLQSNSFATIPSQTFNSLPNIKSLYLQNNEIGALYAGSFSGLSLLTTLVLSSNNIASFPAGVFSATTSLSTLLLDNNALTTINLELQPLTSLTMLKLNNNILSVAGINSMAFASLTSLTTLDLHGNQLTTITQQHLNALTSLTTLSLASNMITTLPSQLLTSLSMLTSLDISTNYLTQLPSSFLSATPKLQILYLENNMISTVSSSDLPASLSVLNVIRLDNNDLTTIASSTFSNLPSLQQLFLGGSNPWDCCGLEWARSSIVVQDTTNMNCNQPQLVAGLALSATTGNIAVCSTIYPDAPSAPVVLSSLTTPFTLTMSWDVTAGNAFAVDYYQLEYWDLYDPQQQQFNVVTCDNLGDGVIAPCRVLAISLLGNQVSPLTQITTGLFPYSSFVFRVKAHSPVGGGAGAFGNYSANSSVVMTAESYAAIVTTINVTSISSTSFTYSWTQPSRPRGIITHYVTNLYLITPGVNNSQSLMTSSTFTVSPSSSSNYTYESSFSSLKPRFSYVFTITAYTMVGTLGPSTNSTVVLLEDVPSQPSPPTLSLVTATSITVTWPSPSFSDSNGVITSYTIILTSNQSSPHVNQTITVSATTFSYSFGNLSAAEQYSIVLIASTAVGPSLPSNPLVVVTYNAAPSTPFAPTYALIKSSSIMVTWLPPSMPNGVIIQYQLYSSVATGVVAPGGGVVGGGGGGGGVAGSLVMNLTGSTLNYTVGNLLPATQYLFYVKAFTSLGSTVGNYSVVTTADDAPSGITTISFTNTTSTTTTLTWSPPTTSNGVILGYYVYILLAETVLPFYPTQTSSPGLVATIYSNNNNNTNTTTNSTTTNNNATISTTINSLSPSTNYTFVVVAFTSGGNSSMLFNNTVLTKEIVPSQVLDVVVGIIDGVVVVNWTQPQQPNGIIVVYNIYANRDLNPTPILVVAPTNNNNAKISTLKSDTLYGITISAMNSIGEGPQSNVVYTRTQPSSFQFAQIMIVVGICVFVAILAMGFVYERRRRQQAVMIAKEEELDHGVSADRNDNNSTTINEINDQIHPPIPAPVASVDDVPRAHLDVPKDDDASSTSSHPVARVGGRPSQLPAVVIPKPATGPLPKLVRPLLNPPRPPIKSQRQNAGSDSDSD